MQPDERSFAIQQSPGAVEIADGAVVATSNDAGAIEAHPRHEPVVSLTSIQHRVATGTLFDDVAAAGLAVPAPPGARSIELRVHDRDSVNAIATVSKPYSI